MMMQHRAPSFPIAPGCMGLTGTWNASETKAPRDSHRAAF